MWKIIFAGAQSLEEEKVMTGLNRTQIEGSYRAALYSSEKEIVMQKLQDENYY